MAAAPSVGGAEEEGKASQASSLMIAVLASVGVALAGVGAGCAVVVAKCGIAANSNLSPGNQGFDKGDPEAGVDADAGGAVAT